MPEWHTNRFCFKKWKILHACQHGASVIVQNLFLGKMKSAWAEYYAGPGQINGPREKGAAPVTRIHSWVSDQFGSFSFSSVQPLEFFPSLEIDPLHIFEAAHGERGGARIEWRTSEKRQRESSGAEKEKKRYFAVTLPQAHLRFSAAAPWHPPVTYRSVCRWCE
jgi:hypothetical protein